ncbi:MAG: hypothetical protein M1812_001166 [Candelaria pacifica]|nr:MAG: hypothetical protein M1812_001166 [Candelaria pacifica]
MAGFQKKGDLNRSKSPTKNGLPKTEDKSTDPQQQQKSGMPKSKEMPIKPKQPQRLEKPNLGVNPTEPQQQHKIEEPNKEENKTESSQQEKQEKPSKKGSKTEPQQQRKLEEPNPDENKTDLPQQQELEKPKMEGKATDTTTPKPDDLDSVPTITRKKPQECQPETNCQLINIDRPIWWYEIECGPCKFLAKTEKKLLIETFKDHFKLESMRGQFAFINGSTFLSSTEQGSLDKQVLVATIVRRPQRLDDSFNKVFAKGEDSAVKWWSSVAGGAIQARTEELTSRLDQAVSDATDLKGICQSQTVYASARGQKANVRSFLKARQTASNPKYANAVAGLFTSQPIPYTEPKDDSAFVHGNKRYPAPSKPIGYGLEFREGTATEVRLVDAGLMRAVISCSRLFYARNNVSEFIKTHYSKLVTDCEGSISLANILQGLSIRIIEKNVKPKIATITGLSKDSLVNTTFSVDEDGETKISVADHFAKRAILISHDQPCINIGSKDRPQYFPSCMCEIIPGQRYRHAVPKEMQTKVDQLKRDMHIDSTLAKDLRSKSLEAAKRAEKVKNFRGAPSTNISLPLTTSGWMFSKLASASSGVQQCSQVKFFALGAGNVARSPEVYALTKIINETLKTWGASAITSIPNLNDLGNEGDCISRIRKAVESSVGNHSEKPDRPLVLTFINSDTCNKFNYRGLKKIFDTELGYHNCCVNIGQLKKRALQDQYRGMDIYAARMLRQVCAKVISPAPGLEKTLLIGVHVTRMPPAPEITHGDTLEMFLVTLVSKPAGGNQNFATSVQIQKGSASGPANVETLLKEHIKEKMCSRHRDRQGTAFTRIVIYRSGFLANATKEAEGPKDRASKRESLSERTNDPLSAQAAREVDQLKEVVRSITETDDIDLIYIVVGRNTKVRLFDTQGKPIAKARECCPGDSYQQVSYAVRQGVGHASTPNWFMQKELNGNTNTKPLQLTAYETTREESKDMDHWQEAFEASYDYPKGVFSSKMVAPVHFARLAAKRALLYMNRNDMKSDTAPYSLIPVHENLKDSLYYI